MQTSGRIVELLNDYLTLELTAVNTYFAHSRMCANWGYEHLAERFREISFGEMRDVEELIDRILYFEGVPNLQRLGSVQLGENPIEALRLGLETERGLVQWLTEAIPVCVEEGDQGTREFLAARLTDEEEHVDWFETQLDVVERLGEAHYLAQQVRG